MNGDSIIFTEKLPSKICDLRPWLDGVQGLTVNSKMLYVDKKLIYMKSENGIYIFGEMIWGLWN